MRTGWVTTLPILVACGSPATTTLPTPSDSGVDASHADASCPTAGSVAGCPCAITTRGTAVRVGSLACASGVGPGAVACGQTEHDGGLRFVSGATSVWVPFFTCPAKDTCSAVTTLDELTCENPSTGAITYYAILGAPCFHENEGACSLDLATVMECVSGTWKAFSSCKNHDCAELDDRPVCKADA